MFQEIVERNATQIKELQLQIQQLTNKVNQLSTTFTNQLNAKHNSNTIQILPKHYPNITQNSTNTNQIKKSIPPQNIKIRNLIDTFYENSMPKHQ
jgi:hemoglobin-like flavoprotein